MEISYADDSDSRPVNADHQRISNHKCSKCSKTFSTKQAFLYHSRYGSSCGRFSKNYQCRKCSDWKGTSFREIEHHLKFVHDSDTTAQNLSKCQSCFPSRSSEIPGPRWLIFHYIFRLDSHVFTTTRQNGQ